MNARMDNRYPYEPGSKVSGTSEDAARQMSSRVPKLRDRALDALCKNPLTADECAAALGETVLAVRPRLSELRRLGLINDTGVRRKNVSGTNAVVWCALGEVASRVVNKAAKGMLDE